MKTPLSPFTTVARQFRFYKRAFVLCFFLNVLAITSGAVFGAHYWKKSFSGQNKSEKLTQNLITSEKIETQLQLIESHLEQKSKVASSRETLLEELTLWQKLDDLRLQSELSAVDRAQLRTRETSMEYVDQLIRDNRDRRAQLFTDWQKLREQQTKPVVLFLIIAALALFFGLILPLYFLHKLGRQIAAVKADLQKSAQEITREWMHALTQFGDQPFKNIDFWLHISLLVATYLGQTSYHPSVQLMSEMARLIRLELQKNSANLNTDKVPRA